MSAVKPKCPRRRSSKVKKTGPTVSDRIVKVLSGSSTQRGGTSLAALKKGLQAGGYDVLKNKARVLLTVRRMVANKCLVQVKGTGASGSFRLNKKPPAAPRKKKAVKGRASAAKKRRSSKVKRPAAVNKAAVVDGGDAAPSSSAPKAKKSPAKRRKSPKKTKRPAAAKKPNKSPRKAKLSVARRATRAKAAAKK